MFSKDSREQRVYITKMILYLKTIPWRSIASPRFDKQT